MNTLRYCLLVAGLVILAGFAGAAPVADFSGTPASGELPLTVAFADASTGSPTGWAWFFGDETYTAPWTEMNASSGWIAREQQSSVVMPDGSIVLMGGIYNVSANSGLNDTWRSTNNGATWTLMNASSGWLARWGHSSVVLPDGTIVLTGGGGTNGWNNDTWRSTDKGKIWTEVNASSGWSARTYHTSVALPDGSIVLMGGWDSTGYTNDTWRSTDEGATWKRVNASSGWAKRHAHSSVVLGDGSIVLMGGMDNSSTFRNDTWRSTDKGATWIRMNKSSGWGARWLHTSVAMPDGSIVLMAGCNNGGCKNGTWRSIDAGLTWTPLAVSEWPARESPGSVVMPDGSIVLMGGSETVYSRMLNDTWRFQPVGSSAQNPSHTYTLPGTYKVALQVSNSAGCDSTRKPGYITVTPSTLPQAQVIITRDVLIEDSNDSLQGGDYTGTIMNSLVIGHPADGSGTSFGNLMFAIHTTNLTWVGWDKYAVWNDTSVIWNFPAEYTIPENQNLVVDEATSIPSTQRMNVSLDRWFNRTRFDSTGYQLVGGTFSYANTAEIVSTGLNLDMPFPDERVRVTIVPGSFLTDAPVQSTADMETGIAAWLDPSALQQGKVYNFSAVFRIEPNGTAIQYKPMVKLDVRVYHNMSAGTHGYGVDIPAHVLPENVTAASVSTDTLSTWTMEEDHWVVTRLNQQVASDAILPDKISIYRDGSWYIDMNGDGLWNAGDQNFGYGAPLWTPVAGDWNNDGKTEIGVYQDGAWYLDYDASGWWSPGDKNFGYGAPGWTPVVGDWNGDGSDKAGAYRDGAWYLDYDGSGTWNAGDKNFAFGGAGWTPVIGKWTSDGKSKVGVYRDGVYYIDYTGDNAYGAGDKTIIYGTTISTAITGDWNANGLTEVGTQTGRDWKLDYDGLGAVNASTKSYTFGAAGWNPVSGDWNADGKDKIGIYQNGAWYLDYNGNGVWNAGTDKNFAFGTTGWVPVVGKWG